MRARMTHPIRSAAAVRGFTLIELVVTLTLVSVLALVVVPLYGMTVTHNKEAELRTALRQVRGALDAYKAAADSGLIAKAAGTAGYPPDLTTLVVGVDTIASSASSSTGSPLVPAVTPGPGGGAASSFGQFFGSGAQSAAPGAAADAGKPPSHMVFLRQVPRDPFFDDQSVAPEQQWNIRAYGSPPGDFSGGSEVFDISTKSEAIGLNGIAYRDW